jgi:hypothetical protein
MPNYERDASYLIGQLQSIVDEVISDLNDYESLVAEQTKEIETLENEIEIMQIEIDDLKEEIHKQS